MEKRRGAAALTIWILAAAMLVSVMLPAKTLFTGEGMLAPYPDYSEFHSMFAELGLLLVLFFALFLWKGWGRLRLWLTVTAVLVFVWLHVSLLPVVISGLYLGYVLLLGCFLRKEVFRIGESGGWPADFILGSSAVISLFCLLSALGVGSIQNLRYISLGLGLVLFFRYVLRELRGSGESLLQWLARVQNRLENVLDRASVWGRLGFAFLLVMILLQVGRVNLALDFDTLWYGVRSEYILAGSGGIYEDPGMVGMVYVYSKGWEILTLPLCDLPSHSYLLFFNTWLAVLGLAVTARVARLFMGERGELLTVVLTAAIPGIMNMAASAKTDMITWLIQLMMMEFFFRYVKLAASVGREQSARPVELLILTAGAYLLSLTMKPTALVFSTAVFGMMGLYLLCFRKLSLRASLRRWPGLVFPLTALFAVWARTFRITGMPVTSVFTSILARLGFQMKYPFATTALPANYEEGEPVLRLLLRRLYQMLLAPEGKDMSHVIMAWGGSLFVFFLVFLLLCRWKAVPFRTKMVRRKDRGLRIAAGMIFWPFLAVNVLSLVMLYQVDGNYFMLLYTMGILIVCSVFDRLEAAAGHRAVLFCMVPLLAFHLVVTAFTSWSWCAGFTPIQVINQGYVDHEAQEKERMTATGNEEFWKLLESNPEYRVISFGTHPYCLQFPCNVQSYRDITSPWGNVELVNTPEAFEEYMEYAKTDFIYAEAKYLGEENWAWSYQLLRDLIARGTITECYFSWGNFLGKRGETPVSKEEAEENLRLFDENYVTFPVDGEGVR